VAELWGTCPNLKTLVCIDGEAEGALSFDDLIAVAASTPPSFVSAPEDVIAIMPTHADRKGLSRCLQCNCAPTLGHVTKFRPAVDLGGFRCNRV
jgi:hypothetical protein